MLALVAANVLTLPVATADRGGGPIPHLSPPTPAVPAIAIPPITLPDLAPPSPPSAVNLPGVAPGVPAAGAPDPSAVGSPAVAIPSPSAPSLVTPPEVPNAAPPPIAVETAPSCRANSASSVPGRAAETFVGAVSGTARVESRPDPLCGGGRVAPLLRSLRTRDLHAVVVDMSTARIARLENAPRDPTLAGRHPDASPRRFSPRSVAGNLATESATTPASASASGVSRLILLAIAVLLLPIWALYRRLIGREALGNQTRRSVYDRVRHSPGATVGRIAREASLNYHTARHHLEVLHEFGYVEGVRFGAQTRYFENGGTYSRRDKRALVALSSGKARLVLDAIEAAPNASLGEIARATQLPKSTTKWHRDRLRDAGLVSPERAS